MTPLAHAGGWDEMLALAIPVLFIWAWRASRRERAADEDPSMDPLRQTGTDARADRPGAGLDSDA